MDIENTAGANVAVIIVAAGNGSRMAAGNATPALPKQFLDLEGVPVLVRSVRRLREALPQAAITVVVASQYVDLWLKMSEEWGLGDIGICPGGDTRFESVKNAVACLPDREWVAIHDGVRPLVSDKTIYCALEAARLTGAAVPVVEPVDSLRIVTLEGSRPVDRSALRAVQTPQVFRADIIRRAYGRAYNPAFTDDASVAESAGAVITLCEGDRRNIKITTPEDLLIARSFLMGEK